MQPCDSVGLRPMVRNPPTQSPNTMLIFNHALTPIQCDVPVHMRNVMHHCMSWYIYNECYICNTIHTTHRVSWTITSPAYDFHTSFHSCQYIMHHISTSTYNMSFYVQAMSHTQLSHVMAICTWKCISCQYIRPHILTSKHVTP